RSKRDWSSDVCSSDLNEGDAAHALGPVPGVFIGQCPGGTHAEHIVLPDAGHVVAQNDEEDPDSAADQNADESALLRQNAEYRQLDRKSRRLNSSHVSI